MKYICQECNYETDDKSNWAKHKKSNKHIQNSNKLVNNPQMIPKDPDKIPEIIKTKCLYCNIEFKQLCHLSRHLKKCSLKITKDIENQSEKKISQYEIKTLREKINLLEKQNRERINLLEKQNKEKIELLEKQNNLLIKENEYHKQLVISAGNMIQSSMSTLNHLILNYNNAPILEPLKDYSFLEEKSKFIKNILYYSKQDKLSQYLGDFLVKQYKINDPAKRSGWNSDTNRLTYINRELVNNVPNWVVDKKGIKMTGLIIDPYLDYIKTILQEEIRSLHESIINRTTKETEQVLFDKMTNVSEVIKNINNKVISMDINKYLAPHFYFDKNNVLVYKDSII